MSISSTPHQLIFEAGTPLFGQHTPLGQHGAAGDAPSNMAPSVFSAPALAPSSLQGTSPAPSMTENTFPVAFSALPGSLAETFHPQRQRSWRTPVILDPVACERSGLEFAFPFQFLGPPAIASKMLINSLLSSQLQLVSVLDRFSAGHVCVI